MRSAMPFLLLALLAGCASTSKMMVGEARPPTTPDQVRIYSQPPARYQEIAVLETQSGGFTYGEQNKMDEVIANLRKSAAELGANGVLIEGHGNTYGGSSVGVGVGKESWGGSSSTGVGVGFNISPSPKHARAVAIWVDPADVPAYTPPAQQQPAQQQPAPPSKDQ